MKILFLTHPYPNYVPDLLLHGLRKLLGPDVIDFPRKDCLYDGILGLGVCPEDQKCPGWFPHDGDTIDRTDIWTKVKTGYFDSVVCDARALPAMTGNLNKWPARCAIIDGEDKPHPLPPGPYVVFRRETDGSDYSIPLPMALPEELLTWISSYDQMPKRFSIGFLGSCNDGARRELVERLASRFHDTLFQATSIPSLESPLPQGRFGRDAYYRALQQCRMVLTLAGAGFDTFRFWENAACNAIHLCPVLPLFVPDDFRHGVHILRFADTNELLRQIENTLSNWETHRAMIARGRYHLTQRHLTTHRGTYFLDRLKKAYA